MDLFDAHALCRGPGQFNAAAFRDDVNVLARTVEQQISNVTSNDESTLSTFIGKFADALENRVGEV